LVETRHTHEAPYAPPLLLTKLHPPPRRAQWVAREGLVDRLRPQAGIKLTILAAPAGSGKTTLLGIWREAEVAERPVAWLSLDEGDNDPVRFWAYALAALRKACPALEVSSSPERLGSARIVERFLPELINALSAVELTLILDDFHRLTAGPARETVGWAIEHAPSTFRVVLATRSEPNLPLASLRAHGELLELRAQDLGFTQAEADELLNHRLDLGLPPELVSDLVDRTEGWPAGLYLAGLSLQGADDRSALVRRFGPETRHVVDFLIAEALDAHDQETQKLMLRCSVLDRLCGPLCDAVLEQEESGRLLAELAQTNLFLRPLDEHGEWYRFHHLFSQLLRVELENREPGLTATLHGRASAWLRAHGWANEAVRHSIAAGMHDETRELIVGEWPRYVNAGRHATVLNWLGQLPAETLAKDSQLLLVRAWVLTLEMRREEAADTIASLELLGPLDAGPLADGFSSTEASLAALRGFAGWKDVGTAFKNARRAAELEGPESPWRPLIALSMGTNLYDFGRYEDAERWLAEAAKPALEREQWRVAARALAYRSLIAGELGRLDEQAALAESAEELANEHDLDDVEALRLAGGVSLAARGNSDEALSILEQAAEMARRWRRPIPLLLALICLAEVLHAMSRQKAARAVIAEARSLLDSFGDAGPLGDRIAALEQRPQSRNGNRSEELSERELTILRMLRGTLSERDIGRELYLAHSTIHSHAKSIYRKLGVSSRSEALEHAREIGLI
jgi:LuxR family transcriptional regulator, maltose regulon positive regulatory protein